MSIIFNNFQRCSFESPIICKLVLSISTAWQLSEPSSRQLWCTRKIIFPYTIRKCSAIPGELENNTSNVNRYLSAVPGELGSINYCAIRAEVFRVSVHRVLTSLLATLATKAWHWLASPQHLFYTPLPAFCCPCEIINCRFHWFTPQTFISSRRNVIHIPTDVSSQLASK